VSKAGFATRRDAEAARHEFLARKRDGVADIRRLTVADYLDDWLNSKRGLRAATRRNYAGHIRQYLDPGLGALRLAELRPHHIDRLYSEMLDLGRGPATAATVHHVHRTLRSALNSAVKRRMLSWNPALHVELPAHERPATQVWSPAEAAEFVAAADEDRLGAPFRLMLFTGIRRGEALSLHWAHVDTARRHIVVRWQVTDAGSGPQSGRPKPRASSRVVPSDRGTAVVLERRRGDQQAEQAAWGSGWTDNGLLSPMRTAASYGPTM
jgi:integrase